MASHVSFQDVGAHLSRPAKGGNGWVRREERWPVGGGLISRPSGRSAWRLFVSPPSLLDGRGEVAPCGAVGGEDAPVGKGPRRTRPHPGARTKYIAPLELQKKKEGMMVVSAKVVGRGVDTLLLNVYYQDEHGKPLKADLSSGLVELLNEWKDKAIVAERPVVVPWAFQGMHLHMHPHGAGRGQWSWLLTSDLLNLCISRGRLNCLAMVRFSSEYLWSCPSLLDAIKQVRRFLCDILGVSVYLQVSEVHLCADVAGWDVDGVDYRRDFVSRSRKRAGYEVADGAVETHAYGLQRSGLAFSKHGPMSCSIYDKTREIRQKSGKTWFEDLWLANGWNDTGHVWRVEFRFKREALHELKIINGLHGIENAFDLPGCLPDMWAYAAGHVGGGADDWPDGWLRLVMPSTDDLNRSRWPVHPLWAEVQRAFLMAIDPPGNFHEVIRERKQQWNTDKAIEATMGFATSLAAHVGGELAKPEADFSLFLHWLHEAGGDYLKYKSRDFAFEVQRKRVEFGLELEGGNAALQR